MSLTDDALEQVQKLFRENQELQTGLNAAYRERAHLVAFLAAAYPSRWGYDPNATQWRIVYVDLPTGQASWHISPDDVALFPHVTGDGGDQEWDGHTTAAKYERIDQLTARLAQAAEPDEEQLGQMAVPRFEIEQQAQAERDRDFAWHELHRAMLPDPFGIEPESLGYQLYHDPQCQTLPRGAVCWANHEPYKHWWPTPVGVYRIRPVEWVTGSGPDGEEPDYHLSMEIQTRVGEEWIDWDGPALGDQADNDPSVADVFPAAASLTRDGDPEVRF